MAIYLDCNATTPIDPKVQEKVSHFFSVEFGNAGSRTHAYGLKAKQAVQKARNQIAKVVMAKQDEVVFTSGATESNNLALLGLAAYGVKTKKKHIISTQIEHKAVLEPLSVLEKQGFEIDLIPPVKGGWIDTLQVKEKLRDDTLMISVMHVNNETGVIQPITAICEVLKDHSTFFHVDAAQGFGKEIKTLQNPRIDLISISGHKIYGPKGVGALVARKRGFHRPPLAPLMFGGGQERGLRPGTLPVPLIVGLGLTSELAMREIDKRTKKCETFKKKALESLKSLNPIINGNSERIMPHVLNLSFPELDSEAVMVALKDVVAISNGSACTSQNYQPSHVLSAMGLSDSVIQGALRISWSYMTAEPDWGEVVGIIKRLC